MRSRQYKLLILFTLLGVPAFAQVPADSLLPAVEILGVPYQDYAAGIKLQKVDSAALSLQAGQSLSQLLMQRTPLYFKEYGTGQIATVSFRGTGANHTAVLWNGLPINSPTLGQADFSLLPAFAISSVHVQYGASSALYGSGAIGGSVHLQSEQHRDSYARARAEIGSFGRLFTGIAAGYRIKQLQADTRVYRHIAENNFPYTVDNSTANLRNQHSAFLQQGVVQSIQAPSGKNGSWQLNSWWQQTDREVQPVIGSIGQDQQQDEHLRTSLQYQQDGAQLSWQAQGGWVQETLTFNGNPYRSRQLVARVQGEYQIAQRLSLQAGSMLTHIQSKNRTYAGNLAEEFRSDLFGMLRWAFAAEWLVSAQLRQLVVQGYKAPLTPSAGLEGLLWQQGKHAVRMNLVAGRSYRVPTLNDRFWPEVGNPALAPEQALSAEAGVAYAFTTVRQQELVLRQTAFSIWSDNLIVWRPRSTDNQWAPNNLREVHSRGLETQLSLTQPLPQGVLTLGGQLAYTRSTSEKPMQQYDWTVGKQLAFTPMWRAAAWSQLQLGKWTSYLNWYYTGRRYTDDAEQLFSSLPAYGLLNASLNRSVHYKQHQLHLGVQLQNLLNKQYQNYEQRAMPGRSFLLTVDYQLNFK